MRKKNFLQTIFVGLSVGAFCCCSGFYSGCCFCYDCYCSAGSCRPAFFCFRPASLPARPPLMSVYHVENDYSLPGRVVKGTMYGYGRFSFSSIIFQVEALCHSPVWGVSFQSPAANSASSPLPTNILLIHKTVISRCLEAHRPYSRLILQDTSHC